MKKKEQQQHTKRKSYLKRDTDTVCFFKLQIYHIVYGNLPGLANWQTEKSFKSMRFIKAAAFLI